MVRNSVTRHLQKIQDIEKQSGKPIQAVLRDFVEAREMTYPEFANVMGVSVTTLMDWLKRYDVKGRGSGSFPKRAEHIEKIAEALKGRKISAEHVEAQREAKLASGIWKPIGHICVRNGYQWVKVSHGKGRNNYRAEHRLVIEQSIGRELLTNEHVHHLNGDTLDNCSENLAVVSKSDHALICKLLRYMDEPLAKVIIDTLTRRFPHLG